MRTLITLTVCFLAVSSLAWAADTGMTPSGVYAADAPSVVVIEAYSEDGKAIAEGSGVVIAEDTVVTNCHVIEKAATAKVIYHQKTMAAKLLYADVEHDLCSFTVKNLSAPPVRMGATSEVKVGDAAYAIGAPEGLDLTLSGGLISSFRPMPEGVMLQMTTPISPGSSGGGLFDDQGRLIGLTSDYYAEGEQLNFAVPVEWINELPQRGKLTKTNKIQFGQTTHVLQVDNFDKGYRALQAGDYTAALAIFGALAKEGNTDAQESIGWMYNFGYGVPKDYPRAVKWYRKAAEQGNAAAQTNLGLMYEKGQGVPLDYTQAAVWYRKAAEQGDAVAQSNLGKLYDNGHGMVQDHAQAAAWYRKAAAQGDLDAQINLAIDYREGIGVPKDYARAVKWYRKAAAQGNAEAQIGLGTMYDIGQGVPQDYTEAAAWFHKAAAQGDVKSQSLFRHPDGYRDPVNNCFHWIPPGGSRDHTGMAT